MVRAMKCGGAPTQPTYNHHPSFYARDVAPRRQWHITRTSMTRKKQRTPLKKGDTSPCSRGQLSFERWHTPSLPLNYTQKKQRGTQTKRRNTLITKKAQQCSNCNKKIEGLRQPTSNSKGPVTHQLKLKRTCRSHSFFSFISSHHIPLLYCHSTVRERLLFALTVDIPGTQASDSSAREPF